MARVGHPRGVGEFRIEFTRGLAARDLWAFGEDELAAAALRISDPELDAAKARAAEYYDEAYPLPVTGRRITLGHVVAFAMMTVLEGGVRPLQRQRRRSASSVPATIADVLASEFPWLSSSATD